MRVQVRGSNMMVNDGIRRHAENRLQFALDRFGNRIQEVIVRITDVSGPKGGPEKQAAVDVWMKPSRHVRVEDHQADIYAAIDSVADRVGRALAREVDRLRNPRRSKKNHPRNNGRVVEPAPDEGTGGEELPPDI